MGIDKKRCGLYLSESGNLTILSSDGVAYPGKFSARLHPNSVVILSNEMVVLISSTVTICRVKPKLEDGGFRVNRLIPRPEVPFFSAISRSGDEFLRKGLSETKKKKCAVSVKCLAVKKEQVVQTVERAKGTIFPKKAKNLIMSDGRDEDEEYGKVICPGCGIFMQDNDPDLPGYYQKRKVTAKNLEEEGDETEDELDGFEMVDDDDDDDVEEEDDDDITNALEGSNSESESEFDWESDEWEEKEEENDVVLDGFAPAGVGYGNVTEEMEKKKRVSKSERKKLAREEAKKDKEDDVTVCARCHSLRNYGQVKNQAAENLLPDFDFDRMISTRLIKPMSSKSSTTVVVMVVDCVDFDGSFPKRAAKSLFKALQRAENDPKVGKNLPKLVLVATKVDLLPTQISPARLDRWVRHRAKAGGAPKLSGVYMVSARKDLGIKNLLAYIKELAGPRGNVWVIGAQNAGKSTLINAFSKKDGAKVTRLTEAPVPGTTLGILRIGGVLSAKAKMYDTPGLLHPYIMSLRLNSEERKMVEIRKELQPRSYRAGQSVHIGGLVRLDLVRASVETIYITIWASHSVSLHLGKTENAEEIFKGHSGLRLQPPIGEKRACELGEWEEKEIQVTGSSWEVKSIDVAVAGLGWFSLGLKGEATLALWTYQGIDVTLREPLVIDRAPFLERPGFWLPKAITEALGTYSSKLDDARRRKKQQDSTDFLSDIGYFGNCEQRAEMKRKCRIWLPKQLESSDDLTTYSLLFGWFVCHSSSCLDVVVAFISDESSFSNGGSMLQEVLHETNEKMPLTLRDKTTFTLLGRYDICLNANGNSSKIISTDKDVCSKAGAYGSLSRYSSLSCGCHRVDGLLEDFRKDSVPSHWIHMVHDSRLHHIHWNGDIVSQCDVHVIVYDTPVFGSHHFSLSFWNSSPPTKAPLKKPNWVDDLHKRQPLNEMETVILSINCASSAKIAYKKLITLDTSSRSSSICSLISSLTWWLLATIISSLSSLHYSFIRFFYVLSSFPIFSWVHIASRRVFKNTWINFRVRSCQILYWPIFLQENDMTSISCVEHAEKAALQRHSTWSAMAVDLVLGNLIGLSLLFNTGSVCSWILTFAKEFTNEILRSGCVWLMGVPAGFKLNTELAGVLGMVSLNGIQIWSTLWFFMASFIFYLIRVIAITGITFGATVSAAFVIDAISFATLHITALHWAITLVYSHQIQALAALWRLFRGRKLNPLRQRLDSYGYTVKQHVVGSLLFTPLLLLLPTTSVFYIFFTITSTAINSVCMFIEFAISVIHATPYAEIMIWFVRRKRFPCGVWFEIEHHGKKILGSSNGAFEDRSNNTVSISRLEEDQIPEKKPLLMVSNLRSNFLSIGQILLPHYTTMFSGVSASSLTTSARGVLSGKRMPSKLGLDLPPPRPWMHMPLRQYWILCHDSIISSRGKR
ncbi:unnamed protein product [Thlaspi arvense]|uniref:CP-type G domain-containing protein n=1 Tax=Thlaspi arvense TaxID=13288 RepID=A0AAU9SE72_THLAR|nr:unnamed protein product [Thlaspi arvense]